MIHGGNYQLTQKKNSDGSNGRGALDSLDLRDSSDSQ